MPPKKKPVVEEKPPEPSTPGIQPVFLTQQTCDMFNVALDADANPYMLLNCQKILDDIQFRGKISDWHDSKTVIQAYPEPEILLVIDEDNVYGQNYFLCSTVESKMNHMKVAASEEEASKEQAAEEAKVEEEDAPPKELVPPRPWENLGSDVEMENAKIKSKRERIVLSVSRQRKHFAGSYRFYDEPGDYQEFRPYRDQNFELLLRERDSEVQAVPKTSAVSVQTQWFRKINSSLQYEPLMVMNTGDMDEATTAKVAEFMENVAHRTEEKMWQNETFDVFEDDYAKLGEEEATLGSNLDSSIKEYQSFTDITYSKNKVVSCIDWMPGGRGVVAVSCTERMTFDDRVEVDGTVPISYILIWNFIDPIHPQFILEAPGDCYAFRFNPLDPNILAAGCINGQTMYWEMSAIMAQVKAKQNAGYSEDEEKDTTTAPVLKPALVSTIEGSHKRCVTTLIWLDPGTEIHSRTGVRHPKQHGDPDKPTTQQFVTIASDGMVLFWDIRSTRDDKNGGVLWTPVYRLSLPAIEGAGDLGGMQLVLQPSTAEVTSKFFCTSEEGEFIIGDWLGLNKTQEKAAEETEATTSISLESYLAHHGPCCALERSPFFDDILLTVGDSTFNIIKEGLKQPIMTSTSATHSLTTGKWSPTRAGVLVTGKGDGSVDVWDLLDRSDQPSMSVDIASSAITSLEFWSESKTHQQLLAVGDEHGTLHIMEMPRNLRRPTGHEENVMRSYYDREERRVQYMQDRMAFRAQELVQKRGEEAQRQRAEEEAAHAAAAAEAAAAAALAAGQVGEEGEPAKVAVVQVVEEKKESKEDILAEQEYLKLEQECRKQFGIKDPVPPEEPAPVA
mmetsp:Transcript_15965/g.37684  ORF Transcript_15965/g.37684 Transcript_15965/m.37684 type:complete len:844 (+) Transcript_15965:19-2550(+)